MPSGVRAAARVNGVYAGRSFRPPPRGVWFEVPGKGYAQHVFGDAQGMTYRMRKLMHKTNQRAGGEEIPVAAIEKTSTRSLRIGMATLLRRADVPMEEIVENGQWEDEAMERHEKSRYNMDTQKYSRTLFVFDQGQSGSF